MGDGEPECPICGQSYDHKRKERKPGPTTGAPKLRDDAEQCKTSSLGRERTVYVHLPA